MKTNDNIAMYVKTLQEYMQAIDTQISMLERKIADIEYRLEMLEQLMPIKYRILMLLKRNNTMRLKDIYAELSDIQESAIRVSLLTLVREGKVKKVSRGVYQYVFGCD